jgi:hypothetical protein
LLLLGCTIVGDHCDFPVALEDVAGDVEQKRDRPPGNVDVVYLARLNMECDGISCS